MERSPINRGRTGSQRQPVGEVLEAEGELGGGGAGRVIVRLEAQDAQRWGHRVQFPGGIESRDLLYLIAIVNLHPAAGQWEDMVDGCITQGELHIGIVIGQLWEILHHLLEEARLERRPGDPDGEHRERLRLEQVTPFGPGQGNRDGLLLHKAPQARRRAAGPAA